MAYCSKSKTRTFESWFSQIKEDDPDLCRLLSDWLTQFRDSSSMIEETITRLLRSASFALIDSLPDSIFAHCLSFLDVKHFKDILLFVNKRCSKLLCIVPRAIAIDPHDHFEEIFSSIRPLSLLRTVRVPSGVLSGLIYSFRRDSSSSVLAHVKTLAVDWNYQSHQNTVMGIIRESLEYLPVVSHINIYSGSAPSGLFGLFRKNLVTNIDPTPDLEVKLLEYEPPVVWCGRIARECERCCSTFAKKLCYSGLPAVISTLVLSHAQSLTLPFVSPIVPHLCNPCLSVNLGNDYSLCGECNRRCSSYAAVTSADGLVHHLDHDDEHCVNYFGFDKVQRQQLLNI